MPDFKLSREAKADLKSIARYTDAEWGYEQTDLYLRRFDQSFQKLAETPNLGQRCEDIRPGYRRYPHGSHVIFYRQAEDGTVEIIRILHKRMLPDSYL